MQDTLDFVMQPVMQPAAASTGAARDREIETAAQLIEDVASRHASRDASHHIRIIVLLLGVIAALVSVMFLLPRYQFDGV